MAVSERRGLGRWSPAEWGQRLLLLLLLGGCSGRIHRLVLTGEKRADIQLNSFGFYANGSLEVDLRLLRLDLQETDEKAPLVGFSLSRVRSGGIRSYSTRDYHDCPLQRNSSSFLVLFLIDTKGLQCVPDPRLQAPASHPRVQVRKYGEQKKLFISPGLLPEETSKPALPKPEPTVTPEVDSGTSTVNKAKAKLAVSQDPNGKDKELVLGLSHLNNSYNFSFHVVIGSRAEEGQYNLNFHNCYNSMPGRERPFDITVMIREKNPDGFLSAAEIPLFKLYLIMSACFLAAGVFWVSVLCRNTYNVFKIHWLMAALAFTKSISLLFHSINYYFINSQGHPIEGLAVVHYITHLLKGALLFITIALIGSGWAFIKYILSDKEKKVFGVVIPLQVLANVAYIVIESREEGASDYGLWKEILFLVDLICCGAILFPVVWSIRHLQDASDTDGKVAVNLAKLKLFRHYYVMVICYVYFTRIIAILLRVAVPFQWQWLYQLLVEGSTLAFFVLTGYKFQPAGDNPYLQLPQEDEEDVQMEQVMTDSGFREGLSKVNKTASRREFL
ncbi:protein GPR108 isoform X1 [Urocitellus parryii]|uniref:protein GPR108 isoform X1 n=2 Tax=Urocitellus parryii TaxID=9999 RepID=UPI000E55FB5D|nr:protein GPR108 isoform X1 [Urocitellus parryii]